MTECKAGISRSGVGNYVQKLDRPVLIKYLINIDPNTNVQKLDWPVLINSLINIDPWSVRRETCNMIQ